MQAQQDKTMDLDLTLDLAHNLNQPDKDIQALVLPLALDIQIKDLVLALDLDHKLNVQTKMD